MCTAHDLQHVAISSAGSLKIHESFRGNLVEYVSFANLKKYEQSLKFSQRICGKISRQNVVPPRTKREVEHCLQFTNKRAQILEAGPTCR